MGRAGDARVVVADRLLALPGQLLVVEVEPAGNEAAQVVLVGERAHVHAQPRVELPAELTADEFEEEPADTLEDDEVEEEEGEEPVAEEKASGEAGKEGGES